MLRVFSFILLCFWLAIPVQVQAGKKTPIENNLPSPWPGLVLNMVNSNLAGPTNLLQTSIAPLPPFPTCSWMKELPCLINRGTLSLKLTKANTHWRLFKKEKLRNVGCTICNGVTELIFRNDISTHYSELVIQEHETAILNMACQIDDNSVSLSEDDVICPKGARHNSLSKKVAKVISSLDKLIENSQLSTFASWRPFSNAIRLYIDSEGYTHITYYQTTRRALKPLASAAYSEAHALTFTSHITPEKPIVNHKVKKLEVVAIIDKAPVANHRANRREAPNGSGWIKRYRPRYLDFKTDALPPEFTTVLSPAPVVTEDEYDGVIPETPPELMVREHSPSPNSFSLHLSQDTYSSGQESNYLPDSTEAVWAWFQKANPEHEGAAEVITAILRSGSDSQQSSQDSEQQTSIELSPIPSSPDHPPIALPAKSHPEASKGKSKKRIRRKRSAFSPPFATPPREPLQPRESSQNSSSSQSSLLKSEPFPAKVTPGSPKETPRGLENNSSSESIQPHQPDDW